MPIYEFHSPDTGKIYSFYAPSFTFSELVPKCPDGKKNKMHSCLEKLKDILYGNRGVGKNK